VTRWSLAANSSNKTQNSPKISTFDPISKHGKKETNAPFVAVAAGTVSTVGDLRSIQVFIPKQPWL
jgi:hypothetical protein